MTARSEHEVILDHALRNEERLGIALKIGLAYSDLCRRVIVGFLEAVEKVLTPRLGSGWKVTVFRDPARLEESDHWLEAHLSTHPGQFRVILGGDGTHYPKQVYFGVRSDSSSHPELVEHVRETINARHRKGYRGSWSFWYKYVDKTYSPWGSEDATLLLYRKDEAVTYFVEHLASLAQVVEQALAEKAIG